MKRVLAKLPQMLAVLYERLPIGVIYSGDAQLAGSVLHHTYHPRHWKSYREVAGHLADALGQMGFRQVHVLPDDRSLASRIEDLGIGMAWLNTGGVQGRNAIAHGASLLEMLGIPYVGHSPLDFALMDHKAHLKRCLANLRVPTAPFAVWEPADGSPAAFYSQLQQKESGCHGPWVVKPVTGRASRFITVARTKDELLCALKDVHRATGYQVLVETYLPGREFCVSCAPGVSFRDEAYSLGGGPLLFSFAERCFNRGEFIFTSIDKKGLGPGRVKLLDSKQDAAEIAELSDLAGRFFSQLKLKHLVRMDFRQDAEGRINLLEVNPKPDLKRPNGSHASLVTLGLSQLKMTYQELIGALFGARLAHALAFNQRATPHIAALLQAEGLLMKEYDYGR